MGIGNHYVPQKYLQGFASPSKLNSIWRYEKGRHKPVFAAIKKFAQEKGFYSDETETYLSTQIEGPANPVIDKIRRREMISPEEKAILANYMATMLKRVPRSQQRFKVSARQLIPSVFGVFEAALARRDAENPSDPNLPRWKEELTRLRRNYESSVPREIWYKIMRPSRTPLMLFALNAMKWRFLECDGDHNFLTCDNPVFYFTNIGMQPPYGEVSFPISLNITLWANWREERRQGFIPANKHVVHEINCRTVMNATRYVFYKSDEQWVSDLVNMGELPLNLLP